MRRFGWQLTVNYLRVVPIFYSKSSHILPAMPPRTKRKLNKKTSDDKDHSDSDGDTVKQPCKYGDSCYRKNPDHLRKYSHSDSSAPAAKSRKLNHDDEDPNSWTVVQLRAFLKENGHTTSGTKVDLVKRVNKLKGNEVSDSDSGSDEEASASEEEEIVQPKTRASTSAQAKKKESQEDLDGEQEEENNGEAVIKNTWEKVDTVFYCIPKRAHKSSKIASFDMVIIFLIKIFYIFFTYFLHIFYIFFVYFTFFLHFFFTFFTKRSITNFFIFLSTGFYFD